MITGDIGAIISCSNYTITSLKHILFYPVYVLSIVAVRCDRIGNSGTGTGT